jgi:hypothetical protein
MHIRARSFSSFNQTDILLSVTVQCGDYMCAALFTDGAVSVDFGDLPAYSDEQIEHILALVSRELSRRQMTRQHARQAVIADINALIAEYKIKPADLRGRRQHVGDSPAEG